MSKKATSKRINLSHERRTVRRILNDAGEDAPKTVGNRIYKTRYGQGINRRSIRGKDNLKENT